MLERFARVKAVIVTADPSLTQDQVEALAQQRLQHHEDGLLPPDFLLQFYHRKQIVAVQDLSAAYDDLRLADPVESRLPRRDRRDLPLARRAVAH